MNSPNSSDSLNSTGIQYNKSFQYLLLAHLYHSIEFLEFAVDNLSHRDFDLPICKLYWESLKGFYKLYRAKPTAEVMENYILKTIENKSGEIQNMITPEEYPAFAEMVSYIHGFTEDQLNIDYMKSELSRYITWMRVSSELNRMKIVGSGDPTGHVTRMMNIVKDAQQAFTDDKEIDFISDNPEMMEDMAEYTKVSTGIPILDMFLDGGPSLKELSMITAHPGVGKSNFLIQLCVAASLLGRDALLITLELPGMKMKRRFMAMTAGVEGKYIKTPIDLWPRKQLVRLAAVLHPEFPAYNRCAIVDRSKGKPTTGDIENIIIKWKDKIKKIRGTDESCQLVAVDWLDYIMPAEFMKNKDDWEKYITTTQELSFITKRQNVTLWTANQGTRESDGKTIMKMKDTARGYHTNDALDAAMGLALHPDYQMSEDALEQGASLKHDDRKFIATVNKNREGSQGVLEIYQAPTLRFFNNVREYQAYSRALDAMINEYQEIYNIIKPREFIHNALNSDPFKQNKMVS